MKVLTNNKLIFKLVIKILWLIIFLTELIIKTL